MGLFLLNISVDTADPQPENIPEDLSFNDQESIIEILVEQVFGFQTAFKEYDDPDTKDLNNKKNLKIDLSVPEIIADQLLKSLLVERDQLFPDYSAGLIHSFNEIDCPPPKVWFFFSNPRPPCSQ